MPKNIIRPDSISVTTHHLHLGFNDEVLAHATGFIYRHKKKYYLITNWHNVTGKHPDTKKHLSENASEPNIICTYFRKKESPGEMGKELISLYAEVDSEMRPIWKEHPAHGSKVDVVAVPLPESIVSRYELFPINDVRFDTEFKEEVADEAFVIGYPFDELTYLGLPIWKKLVSRRSLLLTLGNCQ